MKALSFILVSVQVFLFNFHLVLSQNFSYNVQQLEICLTGKEGEFGVKTYEIKCNTTVVANLTPVVTEVVYGLKNNISETSLTGCKYSDKDCINEDKGYYCRTFEDTCSIDVRSMFMMDNCNGLADYLNVKYVCLPTSSESIEKYNICDDTITEITNSNGYIESPNFPNYTILTQECRVKIVAPADKIINIWFIMVNINVDQYNDNCTNDYVKITDNTGVYLACGYSRPTFQNKLSSSTVYVSYMTYESMYMDLFSGFKLYYEFVERSTIPNFPIEISKKPAETKFKASLKNTIVSDLVASDIKKEYICRGDEAVIEIPENYMLLPIDAYYGVTDDQTCNSSSINGQNCKSPYTISCNRTTSCRISFNYYELNNCDQRAATYICIVYRLVPYVTSRNYTICNGNLDTDDAGTLSGVITSPNYPNGLTMQYCQRTIQSPAGTVITVYLNDVDMGVGDLECKYGLLVLISNDCGILEICRISNRYIFTSCSNSLVIRYEGSSNKKLRGFNLYFEVMVNLDKASDKIKVDGCFPNPINLTCYNSPSTQFTPFVFEVFYGINNRGSCEFNDGDCYYSTNDGYSGCTESYSTCLFNPTRLNLTNCGNVFATYFTALYKCIPIESAVINNYDICDKSLKNITDANGFISSPNYPTYTFVTEECTQKIIMPYDKTVNIWIASDIELQDEDDSCSTGYLKITDNNTTLKVCRFGKTILENVFCSSVIYVSYIAPKNLSGIYKGVRLYFEAVNKEPKCYKYSTVVTSTKPISTSTTTLTSNTVTVTTVTKTKQPTRYVTSIMTEESSKHLIAWLFGIGVPLVVIIAIIAFFIYRRSKKLFNERIGFSKIDS